MLTMAAVSMLASADDSTAQLKAGSIVFIKNTPVEMAAEDLYVSPKQVRIRFEFKNPTKEDIDTLVAFPLPDIDTMQFYGSGAGTMTNSGENFIGFKAIVDGKPAAFTIEQRAFLKGKDVTGLLHAAGVVLNPVTDGGYAKLDKTPLVKLQALQKSGLIDLSDMWTDDGKGRKIRQIDVVPLWVVKTRFYWSQQFPAGKTVVIEHSYQPVTGGSFFSTESDKQHQKYYDVDYCFDQATWAGLKARTAAAIKTQTSYLTAWRTDYILSTAGNWQGPIGRFHLTLDKLKPNNIISLCWDGPLKKTSPTTYEFTQTSFAPKRDIRMVVLDPEPPQ